MCVHLYRGAIENRFRNCVGEYKKALKESRKIMNVGIELNNTVNKALLEFNFFIHNCLDTSSLRTVRNKKRRLYSQAKTLRNNAQRAMCSHDYLNSYYSIGYSSPSFTVGQQISSVCI